MTDENQANAEELSQNKQETVEHQDAAENTSAPSETPEDDTTEESGTDTVTNEPDSSATEEDPRGVQKRINKIVAQKKALEDKVRGYEEQLANQELHKLTQRDPETGAQLQKPSRHDYSDAFDYIEALEDYSQKSFKAQNEARKRRDEFQSYQQKRAEFEKREDVAKEKYEDYDVVVTDNLPVTNEMANVLLDNPYAPDILYHLGKNRTEAMRIATLSERNPAAAAYELGKIESSLKVPKRTTSSAPPPIKRTGGSGMATKRMENMSNSELQKYLYPR